MAVASQEFVDLDERAAELQKRFLDEYSVEEFDNRDVDRIRYNIDYVKKFLQQKNGNIEAALTMMVEALKWRKSFGVQDMRYDKLELSLVHLGLAYHHGNDRDGNTLVILNCHLHKKDSKKLPELEKFFVFALESHSRLYPKKRVTMIFNMSQCGLSNMDLEFVKIIINCFKFYFPSMLGYLLVFEMPWLLQAAWKIIKSWLGEAAISKIKFVTKSDITDYVASDQLLPTFGGESSWQYNSEEYIEQLKAEGISIWSKDPLSTLRPEITNETNNNNVQNPDESVTRQVRFAPGQSPTHQTRYGTDEDQEQYRRRSMDPQLLRGTAASPGYRRRQVNRLIHTQKPNGKMLVQSSSIDYSSLPSAVERRKLPDYLLISPEEELLFCGQSDQELYCTLELTNTSDEPVAYKIKTTAPNRYKVRPNLNLVDPKSKATIQVQLNADSSNLIGQDKFLVQTHKFEAGVAPPSPTSLPEFWKHLDLRDIYEHRMKCRYSSEVLETTPNQALPTREVWSKKDQRHRALIRKIDTLSNEVKTLQDSVKYLMYLLMTVLILLIMSAVF